MGLNPNLVSLLGTSTSPDLTEILKERLATHPRGQLMLELLSRRAAEAAQEPAEEEGALQQAKRVALRAHHLGERLQKENERLSQMIEQLALALGGCPDCWGEHVACIRCAGAGQSGWRLPDAERFGALVTPAIERISQLRRRRPQKREPEPQPQPNQSPTIEPKD